MIGRNYYKPQDAVRIQQHGYDTHSWLQISMYTLREFMFRREVGLLLRSTLSLWINTKIIGNMNWS